ncbi:MAG: hypothetical protein E6Q68_06440 [Polynucleobacter sp.]|nr:MAG: hypothetical protein E6Q68_06440 [Polynucleobacter sp.]
MSKREVSRILSHQNKRVNEPSNTEGILARLFRMFLFSMNIGELEWEHLMYRYMDARSKLTSHRPEVETSVRGNLVKALVDQKMTIKKFNQAAAFLGSTRMEISVTLHFKGRLPITQTVEVYPGVDTDNFDDELENINSALMGRQDSNGVKIYPAGPINNGEK